MREAVEQKGQPGSSEDSVTWGLKEVLVGIVVVVLLWQAVISVGPAVVGATNIAPGDEGAAAVIFAIPWVMAGVAWLLLRLFNIPRGYLLLVTAITFVVIGVAFLVAPSEGFFHNVATWMLPSVAHYGLWGYVVYNIAAGDGGWSQAVRQIQLRLPRNRDDYLWALGIFAVTWIAVRAWTQGMIVIGAPDWLRVPDNATAAINTYGIFLLLVVSIVTASIFEELVFRGLIFKGLISRARTLGAVLISSLLFALLHYEAGFGILPATFIVALGMVWIYHKTKSMVLTIIAHGLSNAITLFIVIAFGSAI